MDTFGLVPLVALYCNGLAPNSWYVLVGLLKYLSSALAQCHSSVGVIQVLWLVDYYRPRWWRHFGAQDQRSSWARIDTECRPSYTTITENIAVILVDGWMNLSPNTLKKLTVEEKEERMHPAEEHSWKVNLVNKVNWWSAFQINVTVNLVRMVSRLIGINRSKPR